MADPKPDESDYQVEQTIGNLLRWGVITAAVVVFLGAVLYLARNGLKDPEYKVFHGEPGDFDSPVKIVRHALSLDGQGLIQLGLLLLIATPVARVIFSVYAFARQRDNLYVILTLIVLAVLLYSLFAG